MSKVIFEAGKSYSNAGGKKGNHVRLVKAVVEGFVLYEEHGKSHPTAEAEFEAWANFAVNDKVCGTCGHVERSYSPLGEAVDPVAPTPHRGSTKATGADSVSV